MDYQQVFQVKNEGSWQGRSAQSLLCASHRRSDLGVSVPVFVPPSFSLHVPSTALANVLAQRFPGRFLEAERKQKQPRKPG